MSGVDPLLGAFTIGTLINFFLNGLIWMQTVTYFQTYEKSERVIYKVAVITLFILGTTHTAVSGYTVYEAGVTHFGDAKNLFYIPFSFCLDPILTALIALIVEVFYAYRVYIMSNRSKVVPAIILVLGVTQLGFGFFCTIYAFQHPSYLTIGKITYAVASWLFLMAGGDVLITGIIYYYLSRARYNDGYAKTNDVIEKVIRLVVASNALTAVTAFISALFFVKGAGAWHVIAGLNISKFYQISLLASLNSRGQLQKEIQGARTYGNGKPSILDVHSQIPVTLPERSRVSSRHSQIRRGSYTSTKDHTASLDPITVTVQSEVTEFRVEDWEERHHRHQETHHVGDVNGLLPVPDDKPFQSSP